LRTIDGNSKALQITPEMPLMKLYDLIEQVTGIPKGHTWYKVNTKIFSLETHK
jgi:hypothetical protein